MNTWPFHDVLFGIGSFTMVTSHITFTNMAASGLLLLEHVELLIRITYLNHDILCEKNCDPASVGLHYGPLYLQGLTLIPAWISNYIHYKAWDYFYISKRQWLHRWSLRNGTVEV